MSYNLGPASRFDDGLNFNDTVGIFDEDTATPAGQSGNKGNLILNTFTTRAELWQKWGAGNDDYNVLAEREENPSDSGVPFWNDTLRRYETNGVVISDVTDFHNGTFKEEFDAVATSDGVTVTMSLEMSGGGDLNMIFSDGVTFLDTTPALTIVLTAGTDASPQSNYIYIPRSTKVLTKSTTQWPSAEHLRVSYFLVPSATSVQAEGTYVTQNWNDHSADNNGQGHVVHMTAWIREQPAKWFKGVDPDGTGGTYITDGAGTSSYFKSTSGIVSQLHKHTLPAYDSDPAGGNDEILVINHNSAAYTQVQDLSTLTEDSTGSAIGNNRYFNCVFIGVANKDGEFSPLLMNLPSGTYNNLSDAQDDVDKFDNLTVPREFILEAGVAFLINRITFRRVSGEWVHQSVVDLRSTQASAVSGGLTPSGDSSFSDSAFSLFNNVDPTKLLNWDLAAITTATTRTITAPDRNLNLSTPIFDSLDIVGSSVFNSGAADSDFQINKLTSGIAHKYDAGLDTHVFGGDTTFADSVIITGNLIVNGTTVTQNIEELLVEDNLILINWNETGAGVTAGFAGTEVDRGTSSPFRDIFNESNNFYEIGEYFQVATGTVSASFTLHEEVIQAVTLAKGYVFAQTAGSISLKGITGTFDNTNIITGQTSSQTVTGPTMSTTDNLQPIATREDAPVDTGISFWDTADSRFETSSNLTWDGSKIHIIGTTEQLRLEYNGSNYLSFIVESDGDVRVEPTGATPTKVSFIDTTIRINDSTGQAELFGFRNKGSAITDNDNLFRIVAGGHNGTTSDENMAQIIGGAVGTMSASNTGARWRFLITKLNETSSTDIMNIEDNVTIGQMTGGNPVAKISNNYDLGLTNLGVLALKETTTPTADSGYGKIFTTALNSLYFQDGAGVLKNLTGMEVNIQTGTTYTVLDSDKGKLITLNNASAITISFNTGLESDFWCMIMQLGAGQVTVGGTATMNHADGFTQLQNQYSEAIIKSIGVTDTYVMSGRIIS